MTSRQHAAWIKAGRPARLIAPFAALRDELRAAGYTVYDIGNAEHLDHQPPEDHTPYSETGFPGDAQFGWLYAIDIMPPPRGSKLPSLQALGAKLVADRKAGRAPFLKYINWGPADDAHAVQDRWTWNYERRGSSDTGHIHASGYTGYETWTGTYSLFGGSMELGTPTGWGAAFSAPDHAAPIWLGGTVGQQLQWIREDAYHARRHGRENAVALAALRAEMLSALGAIGAKVDIDPAELDAIRESARAGAEAAIAAGGQRLGDAVVAAVRDELGDADAERIGAIVQAQLRAVFADAADGPGSE